MTDDDDAPVPGLALVAHGHYSRRWRTSGLLSRNARRRGTLEEPTVVPLARMHLDEAVELRVLAVLRSGRIAQGSVVAEFERAIADIVGVRHAIAVNNGTASLIGALHALGIGPGAEVITSPFTFGATLNAILTVGAAARFADVSADDFLMRADLVDGLVNERTAAIMPVHLFGQTADMTALNAVATRHGLPIIEDAAQALGATHRGRAAGSYGIGSFSFHQSKNITTGEGGVITTDDDGIAESLRILRNQGMRTPYEYVAVGQNLRMTDLQAAVGLPQLSKLGEISAARRANASYLSAGLRDLPGVHLPTVSAGNEHVFHQFTMRVTSAARVARDELAMRLYDEGVETGIYYRRPVFDHECFRNHPAVCADNCPTAFSISSEVLSLPVHPSLSPLELEHIVSCVQAILA